VRSSRLTVLVLLGLVGCGGGEAADNGVTEEVDIVARGASLELATEYVPPPGEPLHHHTAGFATVLCSGVFMTGLDPADAAANVGGFTSPFPERAEVVDTVVDFADQRVTLTLGDGTVRTAKKYANQGCVASAIGEDSVYFTPTEVERNLPPAATTPWPMGDVLSDEPFPAEVDMAKVEEALDAGFGSADAMTLALVVTYKGRVLGERYGDGIDLHTPLESWSMGKSLSGSLMGVLIEQGTYELWQPAPIPEWYEEDGDGRQAIRIGDIMRMSSGIRINAPGDPEYPGPADTTYADHYYLYTATANSFEYAATRPQQWEPNTVGRYRNTDPVLTNYLLRLGVEGRGEEYHSFPQRNLFDRIGMRDVIIETDPYGNFLAQGYDFMAARDWARLANLYLQDGMWDGERILPEGYVEYASEIAPAWIADGRPIYGGAFFWVNGAESWADLPATAYGMRGAGGQSTTIVPTHDLVIVRLGKYTGARAGGRALNEAFNLLMEAIPPVEGM
jgi:CubicO group peptidase (beta-lactamase class C family)